MCAAPDQPDWRELAELHLPLAKYLTAHYRPDCRLHRDDKFDAATQGLVAAARRFDPTRGPFASYAGRIIRRHIDEEIWNNQAVQVPVKYRKASGRAATIGADILPAIGRALGLISLDAMAVEPLMPDPDSPEDPALELARLIAGLPVSRGRTVLEGRADGRSLADIGHEFGLSRESIRLAEKAAIALIRAKNSTRSE